MNSYLHKIHTIHSLWFMEIDCEFEQLSSVLSVCFYISTKTSINSKWDWEHIWEKCQSNFRKWRSINTHIKYSFEQRTRNEWTALFSKLVHLDVIWCVHVIILIIISSLLNEEVIKMHDPSRKCFSLLLIILDREFRFCGGIFCNFFSF